MEGSIVIEDCEQKATEINIINWKSIKKHKEKGNYSYICIGAVQVYITPLQDFGKDVKCLSFICDIRHK